MSEKEFIKLAKEYGYDNDEIEDFIMIHEDTGVQYEDMILIEHISD